MDAFEEIVAGLFRHGEKKHWTWLNYKINLTKAEKAAIGKPSMPRPEIDILAYQPASNELLWIECKSYLDSPGVRLDRFTAEIPTGGIPKVFLSENYRRIVTEALVRQVLKQGLALPEPIVKYYLVAGNIFKLSPEKYEQYHQFFAAQGWTLWGPDQIRAQIDRLAGIGYENDVAVIMTKLLGKSKKVSL